MSALPRAACVRCAGTGIVGVWDGAEAIPCPACAAKPTTGARLPTPEAHVAAMYPSAGRCGDTATRAVEGRDAAILARLDDIANGVDGAQAALIALDALRAELRGGS